LDFDVECHFLSYFATFILPLCQVDNCGKIAQEVAFHIIITIFESKNISHSSPCAFQKNTLEAILKSLPASYISKSHPKEKSRN